MESAIERFARFIVGKPLYSYQVAPALAILDSIENNRGDIITVMMSRQSGKNQLSAVLEAFLLFTRTQGTIVKAAPTFNPQIINSRKRLMQMLTNRQCAPRVWTTYATIGLGPAHNRAAVKLHVGPSVMFFSAAPESNVVGATADLLLEIDEAQDVTPEKFDRDFRPMSAVSNSTTVMYGTAWSDDTLLARQRAHNMELEERDGRARHFEYDWRAAASANPHYRQFVEQEIARLGEDHLAIQTQYYLRPISGAGHYLNDVQRVLIAGRHAWEDAPGEEGALYVAGLDVGGEERVDPSDPTAVNVKRDSSVLTIGRVSYNQFNMPQIEIVHQEWWTGMHYVDQFAAVSAMVEQWNLRKLVVDATGEGAGLASLLLSKFGEERVVAFKFTRPSKSKLGYQVLTMVNAGRLKLYQREESPTRIYDECWGQFSKARYRLPAPEIIDFYVAAGEGHDDFLMSVALCTEAIEALVMPAASMFVKPRRLYESEGRY